MSVPHRSGKTTLSDLSDVARHAWPDPAGSGLSTQDPALYQFDTGGLRFDMLWRPAVDTDVGSDTGGGPKRLFVLFSGDALRSVNAPPVFQRWSWAPHFPGHCLYVSDPVLHLDPNLGLGWYAGTRICDPLAVTTAKIMQICTQFQIPTSNVCSYGSSGGGFAALRLMTHLPQAAAIAVNPQTRVTAFETKAPDRFIKACFGLQHRKTALTRHRDRLDLLLHAPQLKQARMVLAQNTLDTHHFEKHFKPFCAALKISPEHAPQKGPVRRILFDDPGGHKTAETPAVFETAMDLLTSGAL